MKELAPAVLVSSVIAAASFLSWPAVSVAQEKGFDFERFQCSEIHREGKTLEFLGGATTTVFSCVERSCVNREQVKTADGTPSVVFRSIYIPPDQDKEYVFTQSVWRPNDETPERHFSSVLPFGICAKLKIALDDHRWTLDLGEIRYEGEEVHATPDATPGSSKRPSYFFAPTHYHGDWSGFDAIVFEMESSGGSYLPAYYENILGDVVLENGNVVATYEIPKHHDGMWHTFRVPLDSPGWRLYGGATSIAEILKNVTNFKIRAEYGDGFDQSAIRNVERE